MSHKSSTPKLNFVLVIKNKPVAEFTLRRYAGSLPFTHLLPIAKQIYLLRHGNDRQIINN
jgi:hypothetical protein